MLYRVILFKLKPGVTDDQKKAFVDGSHAMKGVVPGIVSLEVGPAAIDTSRTHGFDFGVVLCLESEQALRDFAVNPHHLKLHELRESICDDSLAFNIVF